jgi:hypothetical protein
MVCGWTDPHSSRSQASIISTSSCRSHSELHHHDQTVGTIRTEHHPRRHSHHGRLQHRSTSPQTHQATTPPVHTTRPTSGTTGPQRSRSTAPGRAAFADPKPWPPGPRVWVSEDISCSAQGRQAEQDHHRDGGSGWTWRAAGRGTGDTPTVEPVHHVVPPAQRVRQAAGAVLVAAAGQGGECRASLDQAWESALASRCPYRRSPRPLRRSRGSAGPDRPTRRRCPGSRRWPAAGTPTRPRPPGSGAGRHRPRRTSGSTAGSRPSTAPARPG